MVLNLKEDLHLINTAFSCGKDVFEEQRYSLLLGRARKQQLGNVAKPKYPPCSCFLSFRCLALIINTSFPLCTMT